MIQTVQSITELRCAVKKWKSAGAKLALIPTMGNLHQGHLHLVAEAKKIADHVVVSIFVNPTQFAAGEDYESYPRSEHEDRLKLSIAGADLLFLPGIPEMYTPDAGTVVTVAGISGLHCGASRPGHFNGVTTVVCKLFNMVQPDCALFGLKDFQQLTVIQAMVRDLNIPVEIIPVNTVREASGLAMSSRNSYLSSEEKQVAPKLYQSLRTAKEAILANQRFADIERQAYTFLQDAGFQPDYFSICRRSDLKIAEADDRELVILTAVKLGKARLIDNICVNR